MFPMDFKEKLISSFMVFEQDIDLSNPVHEIRSKSLKNFEEKDIEIIGLYEKENQIKIRIRHKKRNDESFLEIVFEKNLGFKPKGRYTITFDSSEMSSGIYFYSLINCLV